MPSIKDFENFFERIEYLKFNIGLGLNFGCFFSVEINTGFWQKVLEEFLNSCRKKNKMQQSKAKL